MSKTHADLARECIDRLDATYDLVYVGQGDAFTDEQVGFLVKGDFASLWSSTEDWESESTWESCTTIIAGLVEDVVRDWECEDSDTDEDFFELGEDFYGTDEWDEVRCAIDERDVGDWAKALANGSGSVLLRIPIEAMNEDAGLSFRDLPAEEVLGLIGFAATKHNLNETRCALDNASPEFSVNMGFWIVGADVAAFLDMPSSGKVRITNPYLYIGNPFSGSGYVTDKALTGRAVVDREDLRTDKSALGYSIHDIYGGVSPSSFEAEIRPIRDTEEVT